jgi:flagellar hook-associated protein 1 FlgK
VAGIGLNIGLKALLASQTALDSVGHNVANANTPGYSRQRLDISSSGSVLLRGLSLGNGVDANVVRRTTDALINKRLVIQGASRARLSSRIDGLSEIETLLGEPGELGLASLVNKFYGSLSGLAAAPGELVQRTGVIESGTRMTAQLQQLVSSFQGLQSSTAEKISSQVDEVNVLSQQVLGLNQEIARSESTGVPANDLRDQRELVLREIGELVDITFHESGNGSVQVYSQGRILVGQASYQELATTTTPEGGITIQLGDSETPLAVKGGSIGGLLNLGQSFLPGLSENLDLFANNLIFEMNKVHSTGLSGPEGFTQLTANYGFVDTDSDGSVTDELVSQALPFEIQDGMFQVNVTNPTDGSIQSASIAIDTARTTVGDLVSALEDVPELQAGIDSLGRLQVFASNGYSFDFSRRINPAPDQLGTFGGGQASLTAGPSGPYALSDGDTLGFTGPLGAFSVSLSGSDFADITRATPEEVAAVLNTDANFSANGLNAVVSGGRLAIQSVSQGSSQTFDVSSGSALSTFGWTAGLTVTGHDTSVSVSVAGNYTDTENRSFRFVANMDGTVGTTQGLTLDVIDDRGNTVGTLDVGEDYEPGSELAFASGLTVRIGFGELSATNNDSFTVTALSDSDTSDVLGAMGMNALFVGTGASDIRMRTDIANDPRLLSSSVTGAEGDNAILLDLLEVQDKKLSGLQEQTLGSYYGSFVGDIGFEVSSASNALDVEQFLEESLIARREQISGVNVDEELVDMIQFEQAFATAAQFIQVVSQTQDELLAML